MINWQFFPKSIEIPYHLKQIVDVFSQNSIKINSGDKYLKSNEVLLVLSKELIELGFQVELSKKQIDRIRIPVLFGPNGTLEKYFDADGFNKTTKTVLEVEAGRGVTNYQFLKDLFQACMMYNVDYLVIAVRSIYRERHKDFETVVTFFETLYASNRLQLPLKGILIIGY